MIQTYTQSDGKANWTLFRFVCYITKIPHELESNVNVVALPLHDKLLSNFDLKFDLVWTCGPTFFAVYILQVFNIFPVTGQWLRTFSSCTETNTSCSLRSNSRSNLLVENGVRWAGAPSAELARLVRDVPCEEPGDNPALEIIAQFENQCIAHISEVVSKSDTNNSSQKTL